VAACGSSDFYVIEAAAAIMATPEPLCATSPPECPAGDCKYTAFPLPCLCLEIDPL